MYSIITNLLYSGLICYNGLLTFQPILDMIEGSFPLVSCLVGISVWNANSHSSSVFNMTAYTALCSARVRVW